MWGKEFERIRLLIAMEHEQMREGFRQIVRRAGGDHVVAVVNHKESVAEMQAAHFNMFLVEDSFPDQGGINFVRYIRLIAGPMSYAPIILGLKAPSKDLIFEARDAGANAISALPMNAQTFTKMVVALRDNPTDFITSDTYNGPDRRKKNIPFEGANRRVTVSKKITGADIATKLFPRKD